MWQGKDLQDQDHVMLVQMFYLYQYVAVTIQNVFVHTVHRERERVRNVPRTTRNTNVVEDVEIKCEKDSRGAYRTEQMNDTSPKCKIK